MHCSNAVARKVAGKRGVMKNTKCLAKEQTKINTTTTTIYSKNCASKKPALFKGGEGRRGGKHEKIGTEK